MRIGRFTLTGSEVYVKRNSRHVITHPDHGKAGSNTMDIALVILDRPVDSIEPLNLVGSGEYLTSWNPSDSDLAASP